MNILAIETSCDETSAAVLKGNLRDGEVRVLSDVVSSQVKIHAPWGGVVPNLAAREHLKNILPVIDRAIEDSSIPLDKIDLVAATQGPGLIPALLIGTNVAKTLSYLLKKPLAGVHHIEGHLCANFIGPEKHLCATEPKNFPLLALVVSGGHTQLILCRSLFDFQIIGQTLDDAAGEAFDKVAKLLSLGYPGGPAVSREAAYYEQKLLNNSKFNLSSGADKISFPRPLINSGDLNFSFSGLKTAVLYYLKKNPLGKKKSDLKRRAAICHEFQQAALEVLVKKTLKAAEIHRPKTVILAGGVAANTKLRATLKAALQQLPHKVNYCHPPIKYCGDNAAMIGGAAFFRYYFQKNSKARPWRNNWKLLEADSELKLENL